MSTALQEGLALFRAGHWFEAHEVLELEWRATPPGPRRELLQGLIQAAVSLEHWRRDNPRGAWGQWRKARGRLERLPAAAEGLAVADLVADFERYWAAVDLEGALVRQGWLPHPQDPTRRVYRAPASDIQSGTPPTSALAPPPVPRAAVQGE